MLLLYVLLRVNRVYSTSHWGGAWPCDFLWPMQSGLTWGCACSEPKSQEAEWIPLSLSRLASCYENNMTQSCLAKRWRPTKPYWWPGAKPSWPAVSQSGPCLPQTHEAKNKCLLFCHSVLVVCSNVATISEQYTSPYHTLYHPLNDFTCHKVRVRVSLVVVSPSL